MFTLASIAVLRSKPALHRALATGSLNVTPSLRIVFAFDLAAILLVAAMGRWLAAAL